MSTPTPEELTRIEAVLRQGQKIEAIKLYRECTGSGLADAKAAVESMVTKLQPGQSATFKLGDTLSGVEDAVFGGEKILAIKRYREVTGAGLAQAKLAVEKIEAELRSKSPERFISAPPGEGCLGMVALICAIVTGIILLFAER